MGWSCHFHPIVIVCSSLLLQMHHNILKMVCSNLEFEGLAQFEELTSVVRMPVLTPRPSLVQVHLHARIVLKDVILL